MLRHIEFFRDGTGEAAVRLEMGAAVVGATFSRDLGGDTHHSHFQIEIRTSNPSEIEASRLAGERGELPSEMTIRFHSRDQFDRRRANIALLKSAYLMLFYRLGYSFIMNPVFQQVRRQIANPEDDILPMSKIVVAANEELPSELFWVKEPEELFAFGCQLSLSKGTSDKRTLFRAVLPCSQSSTEGWRRVERSNQTYCFISSEIDYIENPRVWIEYHRVDTNESQ